MQNLSESDRNKIKMQEDKRRRVELKEMKENLWKRREVMKKKDHRREDLTRQALEEKLRTLEEKILERKREKEEKEEKAREEINEKMKRKEKQRRLEESWEMLRWTTKFIEENEDIWAEYGEDLQEGSKIEDWQAMSSGKSTERKETSTTPKKSTTRLNSTTPEERIRSPPKLGNTKKIEENSISLEVIGETPTERKSTESKTTTPTTLPIYNKHPTQIRININAKNTTFSPQPLMRSTGEAPDTTPPVVAKVTTKEPISRAENPQMSMPPPPGQTHEKSPKTRPSNNTEPGMTDVPTKSTVLAKNTTPEARKQKNVTNEPRKVGKNGMIENLDDATLLEEITLRNSKKIHESDSSRKSTKLRRKLPCWMLKQEDLQNCEDKPPYHPPTPALYLTQEGEEKSQLQTISTTTIPPPRRFLKKKL